MATDTRAERTAEVPARPVVTRRTAEVVALLAAPVLVFLLLGTQGMTNTNIEDQHFYQAYAEHGDDLMLRLGDYRYYWVRLAFILPARVSYDLLGAVGGFFMLRYLLVLLAIGPAYLLLRRLYSPAAGFVAVALILANPVLIYAWGTDYPDSSAVSYLLAMTACLFMPTRTVTHPVRARVGWLVAAGVCGSLAIHSQFISGPLVAIAWLTYLAVSLRSDGWQAALRAVLVLAGCAAAVTGVLSLISYEMWGRADILYPTYRAAVHFRTPNELRKWHSPNWHWVFRNTYLIVPLLAPLLWAAVAWAGRARRRALDPVEVGLAAVCLLQMLAFTYLQFFAITSELEYHVYSSMLWPAALLVLAVAVARIASPLSARGRIAWLPAVLALAVPYALTFPRAHVHFRLIAGFVVAGVLLGIVVVAVRWLAEGRWPAVPAVAAITVAVVVGTSYQLTTAEPPGQTWIHNQRLFPQPDYAHALRNGGAWRVQEHEYRLAAQLNRTMPKATRAGQTLLTWFAPGDQLSSDLSAQYLWTPQSLGADLPGLTTGDIRYLDYRKAETLVLLGPDASAFPAAVAALGRARYPVTVTQREQLAAGGMTESVWVVQVAPRRTA